MKLVTLFHWPNKIFLLNFEEISFSKEIPDSSIRSEEVWLYKTMI